MRDQIRGLSRADLIETCARFRVADANDPTTATRFVLRELARRITQLDEELDRLDGQIKPLVVRACPELLELRGVGSDTAAILLVTAGDNPHRLRNEASFAKLCGVAPLEASSGRVRRHRLNRGGDRQANHALWRITLVRMGCDERTASTSPAAAPKDSTPKRSCVASSATSPARSSASSPNAFTNAPLTYRSIVDKALPN